MIEEFVLTNFRTQKQLHQKLKEISVREGKAMGDILNSLVEEYVKVHGEGNPAFTLDQFQDPQFKAYPAFMSRMEKWSSFIQNCSQNEINEIRNKAWAIKDYIDKRFSE